MKNGLPPLRSSRSVIGLVGRVAVEELARELGGGLLVERIEVERDAVVLARLGRPPRLDVGTGGRDEHERLVAQAREQPFAQLQRVVGRPVEVGEHEHERRRLQREAFEHGEAGPQRFVACAPEVDTGPGDALGQEEQALHDPVDLRRLGVGARARAGSSR